MVYDNALDKIIKDKEAQIRKKAPLFGASSINEALKGKAWRDIGRAWGGHTARTAYMAYAERYPTGGARSLGYKDADKLAVRNGVHDAELTRAAACAFEDHGTRYFLKVHKYAQLKVDLATMQDRLKVLDSKRNVRGWVDDLRAWVEGLEEKYVGTRFFDDQGDACRVESVEFWDESTTKTVPVAWCAVAGIEGETPYELGDVDAWSAGREPPEPVVVLDPEKVLPPVSAPREPSPEPTTRCGLKRAAVKATRSAVMTRVNEKRQRKAAADDAAWKAEEQNDAPEPDDDEFTTWTPNVKAPPAQFDTGACRALLDRGASLVDTTKASTPVERAINAYAMKKPPKGGAEPEPPGVLTRITGVGFRILGDRDGAIIGRVSDWLRKRIFDIPVESFDRNGQRTIYLAPGVPVNRRRVGAAGMYLYGPNGGRLSDQTLAVLRFFKRAARNARGQLKDDLNWFVETLVRGALAGCVLAEFAFYPAGMEGQIHDDDEESELLVQHDHSDVGLPKKAKKCGPVTIRTALSCVGGRSMSIFDKSGHLVTIPRAGGRGVLFVDGAHTKSRGIVQHRNDAGDAPGATLIVTLRRHRTSAFDHMSEAQRLFAHTGIALF